MILLLLIPYYYFTLRSERLKPNSPAEFNLIIMKYLSIVLAAGVAMTSSTVCAKEAGVTSPDGQIAVTLADGAEGVPMIGVSFGENQLLDASPIGMKIRGRTSPLAIKSVKKGKTRRETIKAPFTHTPEYISEYNEAEISLGDGLILTLRAYDDGVAYRFSTNKKGDIIIDDEIAEYKYPGSPDLYMSWSTNPDKPMAMAFQNFYQKVSLDSVPSKYAFLPVAADHKNGIKTVILESDLVSYPGMFIVPDAKTGTLKGEFAKYPSKTDFYPWRMQEYVTETEDFIAKTPGKHDFPWRIISITDKDTEMPVSNLVYSLARPSKIEDISWIKPGKVAWDWWNDWGLRGVDFKAGINNDTYKYYIDFASENGIEYIVLDEGWYDPKSGDMLTVVSDIDLPELVRYGKEKNVDIVLWTVFNVLDKQLEEACNKYSEMGIKGFKVDFLDRDDQTAVEMVERIADATSKHKLFLDLHGIYKPVGLNRTYPNILNYEAVFGMEEMKWSDKSVDMPKYDVTYPYIRMMSGPVDYTPGAMRNGQKADWNAIYYNPMSQGTRGHQTAAYVVYDSPFTMLCDSPSLYIKNQDWVDFVTALPVVFDSTKILDGTMGEYIVTMRNHGDRWYVGGMTDWESRDYELDFSFLPAGKAFKATILKDGVNAAKQGDDYKISNFKVTKDSKEKIHMAPGGGFVVSIIPE